MKRQRYKRKSNQKQTMQGNIQKFTERALVSGAKLSQEAEAVLSQLTLIASTFTEAFDALGDKVKQTAPTVLQMVIDEETFGQLAPFHDSATIRPTSDTPYWFFTIQDGELFVRIKSEPVKLYTKQGGDFVLFN